MAKKKIINRGWPVQGNRCVAFLDILGFKDLVARSTHSEIYDMLSSISSVQEAIEGAEAERVFITKFSDSIVIFSRDSQKDSLMTFMIAIEYLFIRCMQKRIPIKGAVAFGQISVDIDNTLFFGQPLIDAYLLEENLKYYGMIFHHTAINVLRGKELLDEVVHIPTPLKYGLINHYNLNWFKDYKEFNNIEDAGDNGECTECIRSFYNKVSGEPRIYIDNTMKTYMRIKSEEEKTE